MTENDKRVTIIGNGNIVGDHSRSNVGAGRAQPQPLDLDGARVQTACTRYLAALRERYSKAHTGAFVEAIARDERVGNARRLDLLGELGVYVPLLLDALGGEEERRLPTDEPAEKQAEAETRQRPRTWAEALDTNKHLVVIGRAGSGKTTLLRVLTAVLAAETPQMMEPDIAHVLPEPRPLPIFLPLRAFESACAGGEYCRDLQNLLRFIDAWTAGWMPVQPWPAGLLESHIRQGRAWLLLDALDEVANPNNRTTVRNILRALADLIGENGTRLIVTARIAAYSGAVLDDRFALFQVRDIDNDQRTAMAKAIYRGLDVPKPEAAADYLEARVQHSDALHNLVRTPVMLWTAAVVHTLRGELPQTRAALYRAYVDILLRHSYKQQAGDVDELAPVIGGNFSLEERHEYLTYAAFEAHRRLEHQAEQRVAERPTLSRRVLVEEILAPRFARFDAAAVAQIKAQQYLTLMVEHSGLIVETDAGYAFGDHLTMQEFLAGCYLGVHYYRHEPLIQDVVERSWWKEVLLFAVGYLAEDRDRSSDTPELLQKLGGDKALPPESQLARDALAGEALAQLKARRQPPSWYINLAQGFANRLYARLYAEPTAAAPIPVRQEAGLVLGHLYGRPGDETGVGDPRFTGPQGLPDFIRIPPGLFWMGSTEEEVAHWVEETGRKHFKNELPRREAYLDGYDVAKYPTTNAMFDCFVRSGGYEDKRWWELASEDDYWNEGSGFVYGNVPRYWDDTRWNNPSQPVVGVSWYEVVAYCCWLTATLDDGYVYRLPTEAEWERAARGPDGRTYPWGDVWQEGLCNSEEAELEQTSPVGLFPQGATSEGLHDMVGNVWEWCRDRYAEDAYAASGPRNPTGPISGTLRVVRGGAWYSDGPSVCRCGYRYWSIPWNGNLDRGFRCVRTLSSIP